MWLLLTALAAAEDPPDTGPSGPQLDPWVQAGAGLTRRDGTWVGLELWGRGGVTTPSGVRVGLSGSWGSPRPLREAGSKRYYVPMDALVGAWWAAGGSWSPMFGAVSGVSVRNWYGTEGRVQTTVTPIWGFEAAIAIPVWKGRLAITPYARVKADLRSTEIWVGDEPVQSLKPWEVQGGVSLLFPPVRRKTKPWDQGQSGSEM